MADVGVVVAIAPRVSTGGGAELKFCLASSRSDGVQREREEARDRNRNYAGGPGKEFGKRPMRAEKRTVVVWLLFLGRGLSARLMVSCRGQPMKWSGPPIRLTVFTYSVQQIHVSLQTEEQGKLTLPQASDE